MEQIKLERVAHKGEARIKIVFKPDAEILQQVKKVEGIRWSKTLKSWHVPDTANSENVIKSLFKGITFPVWEKPQVSVDTESILSSEAGEKLERFKLWMRSRRYSESTITTYSDALKTFLRFYSGKSIVAITNDDIIAFNNNYILANNYSASFQNQVVNAVKLFFRKIENSSIVIDTIHRPKRDKKLPNVLSMEEVKRILDAPVNIKHRAMLALIYSCGLRCGELLKLKPEHVDSKRHVLIIKEAKGKKDRIAPLSSKIVEILREYYKAYRPKLYLFEGTIAGEPYSDRSLQNVLKQSIKKANIKKPVSLHWLRHSYATHLLENGTDLRYIQEILGHKSSKTTEIYTHVSTKNIQQIRSPFDFL